MHRAKTMTAAQVTEKGKFTVIETPVPECPEGGVLLKNRFASICGSDLHIAIYGMFDQFPMPPGAPGHESVGTVAESRSKDWREGDEVMCAPMFWDSRCFADYQAARASVLVKLRSGAASEHQLMAQQLGTVIYAAKRMPSLFGKTVAVIGQGSAGLFWDFVLKRLGAERVIAFDPVAHRRVVAPKFGGDTAHSETGAEAVKLLQGQTGGRGADVVIEACGSTPTLNQAYEMVADQGLVVMFGLPDSSQPVPVSHATIFRKRPSMFVPWGSQEEPGLSSYRQALDWIVSGQIDVRPITTHFLPLTSIREAFDLAHSRLDKAIKVTLTF